ncbi:DsrE family protein [Sulfurisphaera ohwakuensis]|uniref:DsrE family protein n=1 Tax=Sulfurisphaera ohwakuensis TaxID=69656 RepID=UPI0036F31BC5
MAKVGIVLGTNELSKVLYAGMWAVISTSMGDEVIVFATMDGVKAFLKENPDFKVTDEASKKVKESKEDILSYYRKAKKTGKLKIYACSYASKLFGLEKGNYDDVVDDIVGITSFQMDLEGGQLLSIW